MNQSVRVCGTGKGGPPPTVIREGFLRRCLELKLDEEPGLGGSRGWYVRKRAARWPVWRRAGSGRGRGREAGQGLPLSSEEDIEALLWVRCPSGERGGETGNSSL